MCIRDSMKGADVVEVMALGRNFMLKSEPEPQENDSAEPTATTPESTTPAPVSYTHLDVYKRQILT